MMGLIFKEFLFLRHPDTNHYAPPLGEFRELMLYKSPYLLIGAFDLVSIQHQQIIYVLQHPMCVHLFHRTRDHEISTKSVFGYLEPQKKK